MLTGLLMALMFSLPVMNGAEGEVYYSSERPNTVHVLEMYFNNCPYCHKNAPNVHALADEQSANDRVQVLDVGIDRADSDYQAWISKHKPPYPVLKDSNRELAKKLGISSYPTTLVLDCHGGVVAKFSGVWSASTKTKIKAAIDEALRVSCEE